MNWQRIDERTWTGKREGDRFAATIERVGDVYVVDSTRRLYRSLRAAKIAAARLQSDHQLL